MTDKYFSINDLPTTGNYTIKLLPRRKAILYYMPARSCGKTALMKKFLEDHPEVKAIRVKDIK